MIKLIKIIDVNTHFPTPTNISLILPKNSTYYQDKKPYLLLTMRYYDINLRQLLGLLNNTQCLHGTGDNFDILTQRFTNFLKGEVHVKIK